MWYVRGRCEAFTAFWLGKVMETDHMEEDPGADRSILAL
jgi:hypothetical protein